MDCQAVRSENDRLLAAELLQDLRVDRMRRALERQGKLGTRRSLLARALRLTASVAPDTVGLLQRCVDTLGVQSEVELYVHASPTYNAGCTPVEGGRVFVLVTSALLESFLPEELLYVLGHELGHHVYGHLDLPLQPILHGQERLPASFVLQAFSWQRWAEISADRAGMLCCGGLRGAASGLFKLSSGLSTSPGPDQLEAFVEQAQALYQESEVDSTDKPEHQDFLSSHPFSPVRLRAARAFDRVLQGQRSLEEVEEQAVELMALMEPGYLKEDSPGAETMRRLLFAAGAVLAAADGDFSREERQVLEELLGAGRVPAKLDPELLRGHLDARVRAVVEQVPRSRRAQLVRDLALVARADGRVSPEEETMLRELSALLEIDPRVVEVALDLPTSVD